MLSKEPDRRTEEEVKSLVPFFRATSAFKDLEIDDSEIIRLIYNIVVVHYPANNTLFNTGDIGDCFFIMISG